MLVNILVILMFAFVIFIRFFFKYLYGFDEFLLLFYFRFFLNIYMVLMNFYCYFILYLLIIYIII